MIKGVLAGMAALAIAGSTLSYGQDRGPDPGRPPHPMFSPEDRAAFLDARVAALKAGLELTSAQEPKWPAYEQAIRNLAKLHDERREAERTQSMPAADPIERLQHRADALGKRAAALKQLADAAAPLYGSLDEAQKRRFVILVHHLHPHEHHHEMGMDHDHERETGDGFEHPRGPGFPHEHGGWRHEPGQ